MRGLFLGDGAVSGLWGGLLRAAQYAVALVLGGGILVLLPRRRTPLAVRGGGALGLCLALDGPGLSVLLTETALLPEGGAVRVLSAIAAWGLIAALAGNRWGARSA